MNLMTGLVNGLFSFKPAWNFMKGKARQMMVDRGDAIGFPWKERLEELKKHDWDAEVEAVRDPGLEYPEYYTVPFHAYDMGNLSLDAALEVELAARAVHATVFDTEVTYGSWLPDSVFLWGPSLWAQWLLAVSIA